MKKMLVCVLLCIATITHTKRTWVEEDQITVKYNDGDKPPVILFQQTSDIENNNNQHVTCNHPVTQPFTQSYNNQPSSFDSIDAPILTWLPEWVPFKQFLTPLKLCVGSIIFGLIAYSKTKLTLYSLSKACVQTAFWSLWKSKRPQELIDEQSQDITLLYDIINTYQTDQHAMAISLFLQDVDKELDTLKEYIQETSHIQSSIMRFAFPDMSKDLAEAQARLAKLTYLKQKILSWLAYQKLGYIDKQRFINDVA